MYIYVHTNLYIYIYIYEYTQMYKIYIHIQTYKNVYMNIFQYISKCVNLCPIFTCVRRVYISKHMNHLDLSIYVS